jgi:uncharacterized membrane protein YeiH
MLGNTFDIMDFPLWNLDFLAIVVAALGGVLAARGKGIDLFGAVTLAVVTALGGGTLREAVLGVEAAPWVRDANYLLTAAGAGFLAFIVLKGEWITLPRRSFLVADALALALFSITGVSRGLELGVNPLVAIALGVTTGVAGGAVRDVLLGEIPLVLRNQDNFYATAALCGCSVYVVLLPYIPSVPLMILTAALITALRLGSIYWDLRLPHFTPTTPESSSSSSK